MQKSIDIQWVRYLGVLVSIRLCTFFLFIIQQLCWKNQFIALILKKKAFQITLAVKRNLNSRIFGGESCLLQLNYLGVIYHQEVPKSLTNFKLMYTMQPNQESVAGSVIQATGTVEFEDGLRTGVCGGLFNPSCWDGGI